MEYAIILLNNNQILVKPGIKFSTLGELGKVGDIITDTKVLLYKDAHIAVGTPYVDKTVDLKIVSIEKTDKVEVFKYKSKSRYRRKTGHRQVQTTLELANTTTVKPKAVKEK